MLETQMRREHAFHDSRFKNYLLQNCLSWYAFARELGVQVEFGDIMLVTECSKTGAWASAVYSQSSREFGMAFSAGGAFVPTVGSAGVSVSAGLERIGPVEYRRSQRRALKLEDLQDVRKDHTVFIRGYRLGSRSLYLKSIARKIMKTTSAGRDQKDGSPDTRGRSPTSQGRTRADGTGTQPSFSGSSLMLTGRTTSLDSASDLLSSPNVSTLLPEYPVGSSSCGCHHQ
jgi:hypothetical protein